MALPTRLSCSECGCATYIENPSAASDIVCDVCDNEVDYVDFELWNGETLVTDDDGYLAVTEPKEVETWA